MSNYTINYEVGDIVTGRTGNSHMLRVVAVPAPWKVEVTMASGEGKKESWIEDISDLRNVTKDDPIGGDTGEKP